MKDIKSKGYEVVAVVPENSNSEEFEKMGIRKIYLELQKTSLSVFGTLAYLKGLTKILKEEKPDKVFSYTIKPVIFGSIAAHRAKVKEIYSLVCGLGYVYSINNLKTKIIRPICGLLYKYAFKFNTRVIFQNKDDIDEFVRRKYLPRKKCVKVDGSGVDIEIFKKNKLPEKVSFIMVSRIIREKGVKEYFKAASIIKEKYPEVKFTYVGAYDKSYAKDFESLQKYINSGIVEYIPNSNEVNKIVAKHSVFVLPTYYREGIPKTLLEATAMGRPIITTNTPGCKEAIKNNISGYFVLPRSTEDLVKKMEKMINNKEKLQQMGDESHKICLEKFDIKIINKNMMRIMDI